MLIGLVICNECGSPAKRKRILGVGGKKTVMYVCPNHFKNKVEQGILEKHVFDYVTRWIESIAMSDNSRFFEMALKKIVTECGSKANELMNNIRIAEQKLIILSEHWLEDKNPPTQQIMEKIYSELSNQDKEKDMNLGVLKALIKYPERIQGIWRQLNVQGELDRMDFKQRRVLVNDVVSKIEICSDYNVTTHLKNPFIELISMKEISMKEGEMKLAISIRD